MSSRGPLGAAPRSAARPALSLALALLAVVLIGTSTAQAATALSWTRSSTSGPTVKGPLTLSCASSALCVAVDGSGDALVSTDPGAGAAAWTRATVSTGKDLTGVSCPSTGECVAVDSEGEIFATSAPTTGAWTLVADETGHDLTSVSCGSGSLCVTVDSEGEIFATSAPTTGAWTLVADETGHDLTSVSCTSGSLCVAVDGSGDALTSTKPTSEWSTPQPITPGDSPLLAVSCEASGACAATDDAGEVLIDTNPAATSSADVASPYWSGPSLKAEALPALSCISGLCVTANAAGESFASEDLGAQWSASAVGKRSASASVDAVSCVPASICVALAARTSEEGPLESFSATVPSPPTEIPPPPPPAVKEEAPPAVSLVTPSPKISGTPAAGQTLTCEPGLPAGATATVSYKWLANTSPIAGATNPKYKVRSKDEGDHLQCEVTATNAAGSVEKTSSYVAIPLVKVPTSVGETTVSKATVGKNKVSFTVDCSTKAVGSCKIEAALTLYERLRGTKVLALSASKPAHVKDAKKAKDVKRAKDAAVDKEATGKSGKEAKTKVEAESEAKKGKGTTTESDEQLTVGSLKIEVKPGHVRKLTLRLNAAGKKLADERKRLPTTFTVSGTIVGVLTGKLRSQTLSLKTAKTKKTTTTETTTKAKAGRRR